MAIDEKTLIENIVSFFNKYKIVYEEDEKDINSLIMILFKSYKYTNDSRKRFADELQKYRNKKEDGPELIKVKKELADLKDKVNFMSGVLGGSQWQ